MAAHCAATSLNELLAACDAERYERLLTSHSIDLQNIAGTSDVYLAALGIPVGTLQRQHSNATGCLLRARLYLDMKYKIYIQLELWSA